MFNMITWNVKGIGSFSNMNRVPNICRSYNVFILVLLEPLIYSNKIRNIVRNVGFPRFFFNTNNKIWTFFEKNFINLDILEDFNQVVNFKIISVSFNIYDSAIYAACTPAECNLLWQQLFLLVKLFRIRCLFLVILISSPLWMRDMVVILLILMLWRILII